MTVKHLIGTQAGKALLSLLVLALLAVALQSVVFSNASYTGGSASLANTFTTGSLSHENSADGGVVLDAFGLRPGQSKSGMLAIKGGGDGAAAYTISKANVLDTPDSPGLSNTLTLQIEDVTSGSATLYNGTVAAFTSTAAGAAGTIAPGETRTYRFTLTYPTAGANSALQGAAMNLALQFTGVSQ